MLCQIEISFPKGRIKGNRFFKFPNRQIVVTFIREQVCQKIMPVPVIGFEDNKPPQLLKGLVD